MAEDGLNADRVNFTHDIQQNIDTIQADVYSIEGATKEDIEQGYQQEVSKLFGVQVFPK